MDLGSDNDQTFFMWIAGASAVSLVALWIGWMTSIGFLRGTVAAVCRGLWVLPLFVSFFPETMTHELPRALSLKPLLAR